jgi:MFS family permease
LRLLGRDVKLYLLASGIFGFTIMNGIYPVLFNLYLLRLGYGMAFIGQVNAFGLLGYALAALPASLVSNRLGIRRTMAIGMGLAAFVFGLQPLLEFASIPVHKAWLVASRPVGAVGFALFFVNSMPFLTAATGPEERNYAYSMRGLVDTLSGFFGSLVGGALPGWITLVFDTQLESAAPYRFSLVLAAAFCLPAAFVLLAMRPPRREPHREPRAALRQDPALATAEPGTDKVDPAPIAIIAVLALTAMMRSAGVGTSRTFFNVYLDDGLGVSTAQIGTLFALVQLVAASGVLLTPVLTRRWGKYRIVIWGSLGIAVGLLPIALIPHWAAAGLGRLVGYTLALITDAAFGEYQMDSVSPRWRNTMAGASSMALGLSWTAFAFGGGYMIAALSYRALFLTASVLTAAGSLLFGAYFGAAAVRGQQQQH